jgi:DNA-binding NtrC family response regulator
MPGTVRQPALIVDDDRARARALAGALDDQFECSVTHGLEGAYGRVGEHDWAAALVDYDLSPGGSGLEFLQLMRDLHPRTLRVLYTVNYSRALASDADRTVPTHAVLDAREAEFLRTARETVLRLSRPGTQPSPAGPGASEWFAESPASREFLARLKQAAQSEAPVFLWGQHGVGRHFAARLLRRWREEWRASRGSAPAAEPEGRLPWVLRVPSLDERRQDIPALAAWTLAEIARETGEPPKRLGPGMLDALLRRSPIGGVAMLRAELRQAWRTAGRRAEILPEDLPARATETVPPSQDRKLDGQRQALIRQARAAGSVRRAAKLEGVEHANYVRLMRRLGVLRADTTSGDAETPGA